LKSWKQVLAIYEIANTLFRKSYVDIRSSHER